MLFQAGALETPVIKKYDLEDGWVVTLDGKHKMSSTLETARGHVRVFKTLDAAVGVLFELGFGKVKVVR